MAPSAIFETAFVEVVVRILQRNNGEVLASSCCDELYALNFNYKQLIKAQGGLKKICSRNSEELQFVDNGRCTVLRMGRGDEPAAGGSYTSSMSTHSKSGPTSAAAAAAAAAATTPKAAATASSSNTHRNTQKQSWENAAAALWRERALQTKKGLKVRSMIGEVTHWDVKRLPPGVTAKQYCDIVLKALKKDSALLLNTDGVIRHACYAEGAKYEYICPECS
jgi:hypothetical protein